MQATADHAGWRPARREARLVALCVDALVLAAAVPLFLALGGLTVLLQTQWLEVDPSGTEWIWGGLVSALWLPAGVAYFALGTARAGTLGARLLGLVVRDREGRAVTARRAAARAALMPPLALAAGAGPLWALADRQGRMLHDVVSATVVLERTR